MNDNTQHNLLKAIQVLLSLKGGITPSDMENLGRCSSFGEIYLLKSPNGSAIGYIACAKVNKESLLWISKTLSHLPYSYEWGEGQHTLIYEVAINRQWRKYGFKQLIDFVKKQRTIALLKNGKFKFYIRKNKRFKLGVNELKLAESKLLHH
jgi:hypothetical protein